MFKVYVNRQIFVSKIKNRSIISIEAIRQINNKQEIAKQIINFPARNQISD